MSKRQRFYVELVQDQVIMVSWKQLLADREGILTSEIATPSITFPAKTVLNRATIPNSLINLNTTESNPLKSRENLKLSHPNSAKTTTTTTTTTTKPAERKPSLDDRTLITYTSRVPKLATPIQPNYNDRRIVEAKLEFDSDHDAVAMKLAGQPKGKVHRSMPGTTSCRTKKKTRACFCCSKKDTETPT